MSNKLINKNLLANSFNQILGVGFPIIIQYYLIRHLRLEDIGYWAIIMSANSLALLAITFFNIYLIKVLAEETENAKVQSYLTNSIVIMYLFIILPFFGFVGYMILTYKFLYQYIIISAIPILTAPLAMEYFFQAKLKNDYLFYRRLVVRILFIGLLFLLVKNESDFILYASISSFTLMLENIINFYMLRKYINFRLIKKSILFDIFRGSIGYLPFRLSYNSLPAISIIFGAYILDMRTLAVFTILFKIVNLVTTFISSTVMVLFPIKINNIKSSNGALFNDLKYLKNTFLSAVIAVIGLFLCRKFIFMMFLDKYEISNMNIEFAILSLYIIIHSVYNYLAFNFFLINNKSLFISILNILIILIFLIEIALSKWFQVDIMFSTLVIVPPTLILFILIYRIYLNKNAKAIYKLKK